MNSQGIPQKHRDNIFSAVSAGLFLVLIGLLFVITPNLYDKTVVFFSNFNITSPVRNTSIMLPAPDLARAAANSTVRDANLAVCNVAYQFSLVWGVFLVALLVLRYAAHSSVRRKAENFSDIFFWFGSAYLIQTWLIGQSGLIEQTKWFEFWALILVLLGVSLTIRAVYLAAHVAIRK